jgi:hypothetical protein
MSLKEKVRKRRTEALTSWSLEDCSWVKLFEPTYHHGSEQETHQRRDESLKMDGKVNRKTEYE